MGTAAAGRAAGVDPRLTGLTLLCARQRSRENTAMRLDRLTSKSQEALRAAIELAARRGNPELIPEHLLIAVLEQEGGVGRALVEKAGASPAGLVKDLSARVDALPQVSGGAEPSFGRRAQPLLTNAEAEAKRMRSEE